MSSPLIRFAARLTAAFTIFPSLLLAAPVINLTAPPLDSSTINHGMRLDFSVSDANPMTVRIFGDSSASPQGYLYIADNVSSSSLSYTWNAPVLAVETRTMGLWHFDDGAGTTAFDASANDNDGTLTNGPVYTTSGRLGYALDFDGTNDYVQIADDNSLDVSNTSGALTIEAWVYPHKSGDGAYHGILAKRSIGGANITNYQISLNSSNGNLLFYAGGSLVYISNTNIPANQWSHIAVSLSATEGKLSFYKNGVKTDSVTGAAFGAPNNEPLTIGMSWATTQCFDGLIDEVRLSNQVLNDTEIRNDYDLKISAYYWRVEAISGTDTTRSISRRFFIESPLNDLPVLDPIGARNTTENLPLAFTITSSDMESTPALTTANLPTGASFTDNGDGTGTFNWTPTYLQGGAVYNVTFTATDDSSATDFEIVAITVIEAGNRLPVLASIGPRSTTENVNLNFVISASDIESIPSLSATGLPTGASFTDNGNGTGTFNWTPTYLQGGAVYNVTFTATDDSSATDFEIVAITVVEAGNRSPVLASIGPRSTTEYINLNFSVSASDIESIPSLSASSLPSGATFNDNGNGTGTFDWTPGYYQSGIYNVTFTATDDSSATDFEIVTITVIDAGNRLPVLAPIGPQTGTEGVRVNFAVSASDLESTPSLSAAPLPSGAEFVDLGDGTGSFVWTPNYLQSGDHYITFTATDDSGGTDIEVVHIDIADGGNRLPVLVGIGNKAAVEGTNLNFSITASDIECTPVITGEPLPEGATLSARGYGTAVFDWTPGYLQSGNYEITFTATDDSGAVDVEEITISVTDAGNRQPVLAAIGPQSAAEGIFFEMTISAADVEDVPSFSATPLPGGASLTDLGNGTANFSWRPDFLASGPHQITFTAHDDSGATDYEVVAFGVADAGTVRAYLVPERDTVALDSTVIISLAYNSQTNSLQPLHGFVAKMVVNPSRVNILASARGDFLNDPVSQFAWQIIAPDTLRISDLRSTPGGSLGTGVLATFTMRVLDGGDIPLHLAVFNPLDTAGTTMQTDKGDTVVTVDAVPPGMDPIVEPENQYYLDAPRFSYLEFNDNWALDAAYYQFDGYTPGQWEVIFDNAAGLSWNIADWTIPGFDQLEGEPHTVYFMVTDDAGNTYGRDGEIRWDFFKDETAPEIALLSPPHDSVSTEFAMRLAYDIFDNSPATIRLFGDRSPSAATLLMVSHLQAGDNSLEFNWGDMPLPAIAGETMGLWHFDENAGTTVTDVSENGNDGNFVGNPQWYEPGRFGYALNFDGVDDYLSIPDQASLDIDPVSGALTMEAWVYPHASGDGKYHAILAKRSMSPGTSTNYQISLNNTNGNLLFYNGTAAFISNTHIPVNQWSYVAVTLGAQEGRLRFYLNGIKMDSLNNVTFGAAHNYPLTVGVSFQISQCFDGLIDEIRLTRRILSEAEIAANFSMEAGIYYWRVEAEDGVNENQSEIRDFQIVTGPDTETPTVTVDWPPSGQTFNYLPVIQVHCRDNYNLDKAYYRFGICTSPFLFELWPNNSGRRDTTAILQVGAGTVGWNTLYFKVDDDAGLTNPDSCTYSWNYFYDNSGPRVDITYPPSGETSEILPQITLNYTADRGLNRAYYQIDNCQGEWLPIWDYNSAANDTGIVWMVPSVNPGYHVLFFKITDDAGIANGDSCVHNWTFTYQPEGVNLCVLGPTPGNTYTEAPVLDVCFYAADGIDRAYYMIDSCNGPWNEIWSYNSEVADTIIHLTLPSVPDGTHYVYLKIVDDFGLANADTCQVRWWYDWLDFICDCTPGETNNIPPINVLDIIRLIDFKFKAGPPPVPYTVCSGDADCNCAVNVLDIIKLIDYKFKNGSPPCDCETFVDHCGTPLE